MTLDRTSINIFWLVLLSLIESLQVLVIVVLVYSFIPIKMASITEGVLPQLLQFFKPEREITFYRLWIVTACVMQAVGLYFLRGQLSSDGLTQRLKVFCLVDGAWVGLQVLFVFRILQYNDPGWARFGLYVAICLSLLSRIFWPEVSRWFQHHINPFVLSPIGRLVGYVGAVSLIAGIVFMPHIDKALARIFVVDRFLHVDQWLMGSLWAQAHAGLQVDLTQAGMLALVSVVAGILGAMSYATVLKAAALLTVFYYIGLFTLIRCWLGSMALGIVGTLLAIKLQLFCWGADPLIWVNPARTPLAHAGDLGILFLVWRHAMDGDIKWLWLSSLSVGMALIYALPSGSALLMAFVAYVLLGIMPQGVLSGQLLRRKVALLVLPLALWAAVVLLSHGISGFKVLLEQGILAAQGLGALPVTDCLHLRQFFSFAAALCLPVFYLGMMCVSGGLCRLNIDRSRQQFVFFISVYALAGYVYFVWHSALNEFFMWPTALVMLACWVGYLLLARCGSQRQWVIKIIMVVGMMVAVGTNILFSIYPNVFYLNRKDVQQEQAAYRDKLDLTLDARLVDQFILANAKVAVIGFAEVKLLMDTNRAPYFNNIPIMKPFDPWAGQVGILTRHTKQEVVRLFEALEASPPMYIFVDAHMVQYQDFYARNGVLGMASLMTYISGHYQPTGMQGRYYMALKRK